MKISTSLANLEVKTGNMSKLKEEKEEINVIIVLLLPHTKRNLIYQAILVKIVI